jgi:PAS domain S-box-containing protein
MEANEQQSDATEIATEVTAPACPMTEVEASIDRTRELQSMLFSHSFLNTLATGYLLFDADGAVVDCNDAAERMLGVEREQLMGTAWRQSLSALISEDGMPLPREDQPAMMTLRSGEPCVDVTIGVDTEGRVRQWLLVNTRPGAIDGSIKGVISSFVDISAHLKRERALRLLTEVNRFVMFPSDSRDPLQHLCDALVEHGPYALVGVGVASNSEEGGIDVVYGAAINARLYDAMVQATGKKASELGTIGTALRTGVTQMIGDLADDPFGTPLRKQVSQLGLKALIAIPFAPSGSPAVLFIFDQNVYAFDEVTVHGLEAIVRESEFGISHLRSVADLASALDGTLHALSQMTESRDPYTEGHQSHVAALGAAIASRLGLDIETIKLIRQAGAVHDVGKIAVPAEILTRSGRLSALEFEMVKQHTTVGFDILSKAMLPWPIAEVALSHHERLDGSGYPNGLSGDEIVLPARIIAVADVVEAISQHRPYRAALGLESALVEAREGAGTRYDADVVEACVAVFEAGFTFDAEELSLPMGLELWGPEVLTEDLVSPRLVLVHPPIRHGGDAKTLLFH